AHCKHVADQVHTAQAVTLTLTRVHTIGMMCTRFAPAAVGCILFPRCAISRSSAERRHLVRTYRTLIIQEKRLASRLHCLGRGFMPTIKHMLFTFAFSAHVLR